jgi:competence ComEA-like helix-hairpin-helix protein
MKWQLIFLAILIFPIVSAICEEGQIDVNSASLEELMNIKWLGGKGVIAQNVINCREEHGNFNSLDDLTKVSGIKEGKLADIKAEGIACVSNEKGEEEKIPLVEEFIEEKSEEIPAVENDIFEEPAETEDTSINAKVIKTDNSEESYNIYAILGLVTFSVLLTLLLMLEKLKSNKNEFD